MHTITAIAYDEQNNAGQMSITVTVNNQVSTSTTTTSTTTTSTSTNTTMTAGPTDMTGVVLLIVGTAALIAVLVIVFLAKRRNTDG